MDCDRVITMCSPVLLTVQQFNHCYLKNSNEQRKPRKPVLFSETTDPGSAAVQFELSPLTTLWLHELGWHPVHNVA